MQYGEGHTIINSLEYYVKLQYVCILDFLLMVVVSHCRYACIWFEANVGSIDLGEVLNKFGFAFMFFLRIICVLLSNTSLSASLKREIKK